MQVSVTAAGAHQAQPSLPFRKVRAVFQQVRPLALIVGEVTSFHPPSGRGAANLRAVELPTPGTGPA